MIGKTPLNIQVAKKQGSSLRVSKKGYKDVQISMATSMPVTFFGNIIFGGFTGSTVDFASGAIYEYSPNDFFAELETEDDGEDSGLETDELPKIKNGKSKPRIDEKPSDEKSTLRPNPKASEPKADDTSDKDGVDEGKDEEKSNDEASLRKNFRRFVLVNFENLRKDASRSDGEYLRAFNSLVQKFDSYDKRAQYNSALLSYDEPLALLAHLEQSLNIQE